MEPKSPFPERPFHRIRAWQHAMQLADDVHTLTSDFPSTEQFGLTIHLRRTARSIASNIAEGSGRNSDRDFLRFLYIARGSLCEVETQLELAWRAGYISETDARKLAPLLDKTSASLQGFINRLQRDARGARSR